jgi:hypothetical protein
MLERKPEKILEKAILGMLTRNNLRHKYIEPRLKIYAGPNHPHTGQINEGAQVLEKHPRKKTGDWHFGLKDGKYAESGTYQQGSK